MPRKGTITQRQQEGARLTQRLFDSTAIVANELLAASLQGALTSDAFKWFRLKTRKQDLNDVKVVAEWLDEVADRMYLAFRQSNMNSELQEVYLDLGCFGNGMLYMEEAEPDQPIFSGFRFHYVQIGRWCIAENKDGLVDTVFRTISMTALAATNKWGKNCGPKICKAAEDDPDKRVYIVHAVYPRHGMKDPGYKGTMPYASIYFTYGGAGPFDSASGWGKHLLDVGGLDYFPYMVPRWTKAINEMYGRGPGDTALPDIKTLNKAEELTLRAWAKNIDPPILTRDDGVIGRVRTSPSDMITVRDMDAVKTLETNQRFDVNQVKSDQKRESIKSIFYNQQLQLPEGQMMTATEVERRFELMQRFLGPTLGRITVELLNPLVQRGVYLMLKRNALPPPPAQLINPQTGQMEDVDIEYEGPLARAQRASDVQAIERTLQDFTALSQLDPNVKDNLEVDKIARAVAERNGVPPQFIRDEKGVLKIRQARNEAQQQALKSKQEAETMKALGPAVKGLASLPGVQEQMQNG